MEQKPSIALKTTKKSKNVVKTETKAEAKVETKVNEPDVTESKVTEPKVAKTMVGKNNREINIAVPDHVLNIAYIVRDNAAIRRFTSLKILEHFVNTGKFKREAKGQYVKFLWNKFRVTADGLTSEYSYREEFFIKALAESFGMFSHSAEIAINKFIDVEGIEEIK